MKGESSFRREPESRASAQPAGKVDPGFRRDDVQGNRDDVRGNRNDVRVRCRRGSSYGPLVSLILTCLLLAACEEPFEPLASSNLAFSIYGHLDAAADTQWVRVMPIRESLETPPGPIDAVVTLEELETGETAVMSDSLFRYLPVHLGDVGLYAHNFSTTMPMVPGRHYRLTATRSDGAAASATVLIPVFESPSLELRNAYYFPLFQARLQVTRGTIRGTRHLGMVLGREDIPERCKWPFPVHQQFLPITRPAEFEGDGHDVQLSWGLLPGDSRPSYVAGHPPMVRDTVDDRGILIGDLCNLGSKRVLAIASGDVWPFGTTTPLRELSHPASLNNIEGGLGFLAGVQTHVFPFAGCVPLERPIPCTITFNSRSATLVGLVTNGCTGEPLAPAPPVNLPKAVRVRLLGPPDNGIRYDTTDASGVFQFQGLEPGAAHSLALEQLPHRVDGVIVQSEFLPVEIENVAVAEAAVDTIAIEMTHRRNCDP